MRVLLSIKPEFVAKIFSGEKRYEFRRSLFKRRDVTTVVVYASVPVSRVVGEFEIGRVLCDTPGELWRKTKEGAGITEQFFFDYFKDKATGYAISVSSSRRYDFPFDLRNVLGLAPPQSFRYLDVDLWSQKMGRLSVAPSYSGWVSPTMCDDVPDIPLARAQRLL